MKKGLIIAIIFLVALNNASAAKLVSPHPGIEATAVSLSDYVTYYDSGRISDVKRFNLAFLESNNYAASEIADIKQTTTPVCYVTIGEDDVLQVGDGLGPGGYASWYLDSNNDNRPDQNPYWGSYYVDAGNQAWQNHILNDVTPIIINEKGCAGLFLDTIDTIDAYPSTTTGMISLIQQLDSKYSQSTLVANRGFSIVWEMASYIDGIMFEDFSSALQGTKYKAWTGQDLEWTSSWGLVLRNVKQLYPNLKVYALDYANPSDQVLINYDINRALDFGFIPYVSTINLDNLFFHAYTRQQGTLPTGYTDIRGDVRKTAIDITALTLSSDSSSITLRETLAGASSSRSFYGVMIDSDFKESTGYKSNAIGADYLIENSVIYSYSGDGYTWSWQQLGTSQFTLSSNTVTWTVPYSIIGLAQGKTIGFTFYAGQGSEQDTTVRGTYLTFQSPSTTTTSITTTIPTSTSSIPSTTTSIPVNVTTTTSTIASTSSVPTTTSSTSTSTTIVTTTTISAQTNLTLVPTQALDTYGNEQISPDSGSLDGTVDMSNNDARWLTSNAEYIQVNSWNSQVPAGSTLQSANAKCELDFVNSRPGNIVFYVNNGTSWNALCGYSATSQSTYSCNLLVYNGINSAEKLNNLQLRCGLVSSETGSIGFSLDSIRVDASYI